MAWRASCDAHWEYPAACLHLPAACLQPGPILRKQLSTTVAAMLPPTAAPLPPTRASPFAASFLLLLCPPALCLSCFIYLLTPQPVDPPALWLSADNQRAACCREEGMGPLGG